MRINTVREFRNKATGLLRSRTPILVTRRGRLVGIFFPVPEITLPVELKRELYDMQRRRAVAEAKKGFRSRRTEGFRSIQEQAPRSSSPTLTFFPRSDVARHKRYLVW
jgi:hypothetical protein